MYIYAIVGLRITNGPNFTYFEEINEIFYKQMPNVLKQDTKINGYFVNNFNIMFLIIVGFGFIFGCVYVISSFISSKINKMPITNKLNESK